MYQALYRKWRPKTFEDLVGQQHIATTLKHEVALGKLSHAYLFCGTRGTGKTSTAKILAKAVNCLHPDDGNPCCACEICRGIESESLLDVTEIDAASNSGVDNIRELREEAAFTPAAAKYRVYIIDETHMLSPGAWAALLKILEEPPPHVLFILATTEIHKVPATILSRCQRFDFRRIAGKVIARQLECIAGQEGVSLQPEAAVLIARLADGGMRDALSLLDLCLSAGEEVTDELVRRSAGLVGREHLFDIGRALAAHDGASALAVLEGLWERSVDYARLCEQLIGFFRNAIVVKSVRSPQELVPCLPEELEWYREFAASVSAEWLLYGMEVLQQSLGRMARTTMRRTELEMALFKLADPRLETTRQAMLARIERLEHAAPPRPARAAKSAETAGTPPQAAHEPPAETRPKTPAADATPSKTQMEPFEAWDQVLEILKIKNKALYGTLAGSSAYVGGNLLLVDAGDGMFARMVRGDSYAKESLRDAAQAVTGQLYRLGPYNPERYEVKQTGDKPARLDALLKKASELGVDIQVN